MACYCTGKCKIFPYTCDGELIHKTVTLPYTGNFMTETLALCPHGIPVKFVCEKCAQEKINDTINSNTLEACKLQVEKLTKLVINHEVYLNKIHTVSLADPDKISQHFSELEHLIKHAQDGIEKCFERIEIIEKMFINGINESQYRLQLEEFYKNKS